MNYMFNNCVSLTYLPKITILNQNFYGELVNTNYMLQNCFSNLLIPYGDFSINSKNSKPLWNNIKNLEQSKEQNTIKGIINVENNDYNKNIII